MGVANLKCPNCGNAAVMVYLDVKKDEISGYCIKHNFIGRMFNRWKRGCGKRFDVRRVTKGNHGTKTT